MRYASGAYRHALSQAGLLAAMRRQGHCSDNAARESFWTTLNLELVYRRVFVDHRPARTEIFDDIESFHNRRRAHRALAFLSPVDFENQNN